LVLSKAACCHFFQFSPWNNTHNLRSPWCAAPDANKFRLPRTCAGILAAGRTGEDHEQNLILPKSLAVNPAPSATAKAKSQKNSIGEGRVAVTASGPSAYWEEHNAMGQTVQAVVTTSFLYDQKAGILYAYRNGDFACNNSNMSGNVLEAVYTQGNPSGQPAGSGWYVAELNAGQCGAKQDGVFGCRFDASGQHTACGIATKNPHTGEVDFAEVSESK
jgi:hypothetical protein